jgi:arginine-tRNA-protein transferase
MESLFRFVSPPSTCGYLPDREWSLEHEHVLSLSKAEYLGRMLEGWRRFGTMLFRPRCASCTACKALRVRARDFRPDRSQRRARRLNEGAVRVSVAAPSVTRAKLDLYDRYHAFQADMKGWPEHGPKDAEDYRFSFVTQPFPVEEWRYSVGQRLVGVGYVDYCPSRPPLGEDGRPAAGAGEAGGLSAIYFFYDPEERWRSLGTYNVLCLIDEAARRGLPYVYLGYYVEGCPSMEYKTRFAPNQLRGDDGLWRDFRE